MGVVSTVSSDTQVGFHVTVNGIERMGVSSSSDLSLVRCSVVRPSILWWQNCLAVRCSGRHFFKWYIVWCRRCSCPYISIMSSGFSVVCCGVGIVRVDDGTALFRGFGVVVVACVNAA